MKELAGVMDCSLSLSNWQFRGGGEYINAPPPFLGAKKEFVSVLLVMHAYECVQYTGSM